MVPVFVAEAWWGIVGFDNCEEARLWSEQELQLLQTVASGVAAALASEAAVVQRVTELASVNSVLTSSLGRLSEASDMREFLAHALKEILRVTGAANVGVTRYDKKTNQLQLELFHDRQSPRWGLSGNEIALWATPYDADTTPSFEIGLQSKKMFVASLLNDQTELPLRQFALPGGLEYIAANGISDAAFSVLLVGSEPVGTFHLHFDERRTLRLEDLSLLSALSQQAAIALRLVMLSDEGQQAALAQERQEAAESRTAELRKANEALAGTLDRLVTGSNVADAVNVILLEITKQSGASACHWFEYDAATNTLEVTHRISGGVFLDGPADDEPEWLRSPFDADITPAFRFMCDSDDMVVLSLRDQSPLLWPGVAQWHMANGQTEASAYVVKAGRDPVGCLGLAFTDRVTLSSDQKELIRALSNQLALAICILRLSNRAREEAVAAAVASEREVRCFARGRSSPHQRFSQPDHREHVGGNRSPTNRGIDFDGLRPRARRRARISVSS